MPIRETERYTLAHRNGRMALACPHGVMFSWTGASISPQEYAAKTFTVLRRSPEDYCRMCQDKAEKR